MAKYKIEHNRPDCIGCAACAAVAPEHWEMDEDGKSNVIGGNRTPEGKEERDLEEKDFEENKDAADSCPVNVIHIIRKDTNEKII